jgi:hypothetical protein
MHTCIYQEQESTLLSNLIWYRARNPLFTSNSARFDGRLSKDELAGAVILFITHPTPSILAVQISEKLTKTNYPLWSA